MNQLLFSSKVLGGEAAQKLKDRQVSQTIRGESNNINLGEAEVLLDDRFIYTVIITEIEEISLGELKEDDAARGGFNSLDKLREALKRAGYRFKALYKYDAYRIRFTPRISIKLV